MENNKGKDKPLYYGTAGVGTPMHLAGELLAFRTGAKFEHVPYKGSGPALADVIAGHVPFGVFGLSSTLSHIREGSPKASRVFDAQRSRLAHHILQISEDGVTVADAPLISTILHPTGTTQPDVDK